MVKAAREGGRVLGVNYNWRFLPGVQRIRQIRDSGELGKLRLLRILAHANVHNHALDLVRMLGGRVTTVTARIQDEPARRGFADWTPYAGELLYMPTISCVATLETEDDVHASLVSSELFDARGLLLSLDAMFDDGMLTLTGVLDKDGVGTLTASTGKQVDLRLRRGDAPAGFALSFQRSIEAFYESWRSGAAPPTTGEDGVEVMRLENALVRSHQTQSRVEL